MSVMAGFPCVPGEEQRGELALREALANATLHDPCLGFKPPSLFNELQVQGDAHAVDKHDALIEQLLVGDFRVDELF